jgi:hypothetical protein
MNNNTASPEKRRRKMTASPEPAREPRRLDIDLHGENGEEAWGTPRPCRQWSLPHRRCLNRSGEWRGGEEPREVEKSGTSRLWISADKKHTQKFPFPERARVSARELPPSERFSHAERRQSQVEEKRNLRACD